MFVVQAQSYDILNGFINISKPLLINQGVTAIYLSNIKNILKFLEELRIVTKFLARSKNTASVLNGSKIIIVKLTKLNKCNINLNGVFARDYNPLGQLRCYRHKRKSPANFEYY